MSMAESFCQSGFAKFINSPTGRVVRIVVGLVLVGYGYTQSASTSGIVLMLVGLVPFSAGLFDWCLISALLGGPLNGTVVRAGKPKS